MPRVKIGDVISIDGDDGCFYFAQYTHQHAVFGSLLRVYAEKSDMPEPSDLDNIVASNVVFSVFYPLRQSISRGIFRIIGNRPLSPAVSEFPIFRDGNPDPSTGSIEAWWLWDGTQEWLEGPLEHPEQFPLRQVVNDTYLRQLVQTFVEPAELVESERWRV